MRGFMEIINNDKNCFFDVDETLIFWELEMDFRHKPEEEFEDRVYIKDPHIENLWVVARPHSRMINYLKRKSSQGFHITVWSASGNAWAEAVIRALELERFVNIIMAKPQTCWDDKKDLGVPFIYLDEHFERENW
jgi:hypothetical protein